MAKLSREQLEASARQLVDLTGMDLPIQEIMEALALADSLLESGVPAASKAKAYTKDLEDILGKTLAQMAADGMVVVEEDNIVASTPAEKQALARERAAAWKSWKERLARQRPYSNYWGGPEDTALRKKMLRRMSPGERRAELTGTLEIARAVAYAGFHGGPPQEQDAK